jgi:hypothetical protein
LFDEGDEQTFSFCLFDEKDGVVCCCCLFENEGELSC